MLAALVLAIYPPAIELTCLAAASLKLPLNEIARRFEAANPGVRLRISFAGSQELAAQINLGAPADVFFSADKAQMEAVIKSGEVAASASRPFASNRISLLVSASAAKRVRRLEDLGRPGLRLCMAGERVPAGAYAKRVLQKAARTLGEKWLVQVQANTASYENNVSAVVTRIELDEADAGLVYRTDVGRAKRSRSNEVPKHWNIAARYFVAVPKRAQSAEIARAFVRDVLAKEGQRTLARYGFLPP
jgi:molybdate transport system substrate-binding protein